MSTIAYRDGVIAADTGVSDSGSRLGFVHKIAVVDGVQGKEFAGAVGTAVFAYQFLQWFKNGEKEAPPKYSNDDGDLGLIVRRLGYLEIYEEKGFFRVKAPYFAIGSGSPEARGAMFMGASPEQAVKAAMDCDVKTFGEIEVLS